MDKQTACTHQANAKGHAIVCGLLLVKHKGIEESKLVEALDCQNSRGRDLQVYKHKNNIFIGQTVLNLTGNPQTYIDTCNNVDAFVFNGELYDYDRSYPNDTAQARQLVLQHAWDTLHNLVGPKSWIYTDWYSVYYSTDWQYEKTLWCYQDADLFILASNITSILCLTSPGVCTFNDNTKHINWQDKTFYKNVFRVSPGTVFCDDQVVYSNTIVDIRSTIDPFTGSINDAVDELDYLLSKSCKRVLPESATLFYSGGIDSSLIGSYIPEAHFIGLDIPERDSISHNSSADQKVACNQTLWVEHYKKIQSHLAIPPLSWSWVGYSVLLDNTVDTVVITGTGADELFAGYSYHLSELKHSPYSNTNANPWLCEQDYVAQCGGTDLLGGDQVAGMYNKEIRNPFADGDVIKFAMSLPYNYLVTKNTKHILRLLYAKRFGQPYSLSKVGFTGYCNEAISCVNPDYKKHIVDRNQEWKDFVIWNFDAQHG